MKNIRPLSVIFAAVGLITLLPDAKSATTTVLAYDNPPDIDVYANDTLAQQFTMGPISYNLSTISLDLVDVNQQTASLLTLAVYTDASGSPGALFSSLNYVSIGAQQSALGQNFNNVTFSGSGVLMANTSYWVQLDNGNNIGWVAWLSPSVVGDASYGELRLDQQSAPVNRKASLIVTGTAVVPEPSTYALFGLGALGLVIACRRRVA
jgi:hypothetical protein